MVVVGKELSKATRSEMQELRRRIGVAYQDFKLLPDKTVAQNIAFSMEVAYRSGTFIRKQIKKLLIQLRMEDKMDICAGKLSRGEQQRVAIARAVANEPLLILADEPTGNLDTETTELVMNLFHHCNKKGATLLIATHDHSIYNHPGSKVIKIKKGRLTTYKSPLNTSSELAQTSTSGERGSGIGKKKFGQQILIKQNCTKQKGGNSVGIELKKFDMTLKRPGI
ncbi:MAG: ATP-binding cassette domain-containing protein [Candidatus Electrothrix sp. AR4]|nr:ATP-binding cassette domain-containing protein [Candidatus Electrothrix sp. AR4]